MSIGGCWSLDGWSEDRGIQLGGGCFWIRNIEESRSWTIVDCARWLNVLGGLWVKSARTAADQNWGLKRASDRDQRDVPLRSHS